MGVLQSQEGAPKTKRMMSRAYDADVPRKKQKPSDFAERLIAIRKERGLTQVELAEAIGSTQRAISYYENVKGWPPAPAVIDLAQALGVTTDELLGVEPMKSVKPKDKKEEQRLWKKFQKLRTLPIKDQRMVVRLLNSLAAADSVRNVGRRRKKTV